MATLAQSSPNPCIVRPHSVTSGWLARFRAWRARRRVYTETIDGLTRLDARDLRDLGISRYDFEDIARGTYRR
jgi:uncharacterized protein YjiS (DUF1127 family)